MADFTNDQFRLDGKIAIVTGAGGRGNSIGRAYAVGLANAGASVVVADLNREGAERVATEIEAAGGKAIAVQADIANEASVLAMMEATQAAFGGLDILVNNAGILRLGELKDISIADIDALLDVNVRSPIVASKAALPHLGKGGRIITIGSYFADRVPAAVLGVYAASKSALIAFNKALARELGPKEITVNLVQPGSIDTDMNPPHGPASDMLRQFMALGRYGKVEDIGNAVAFLASDRAKYVSGSALTVDGGANA